ncbi:hypothetical protein C8R44DRAFT_14137 [Mycena epipterygia]|nr:hypothetical protein C8R44DRAFT_14137 [Mycena epipterygia]
MGFWTTVVVTVSTTLAVVELVRFLWGDDSSTGSDLGSAGPGRNIRRPAQEGPPREPATRPPPFDPYSFQPLRPASDASHRIPPGPWSETAPVPTSSRVYGVSGRGRPRTRLRIVPRPVASPPSAPSYPFQPFVPASDASYENPPSLRSEDTSVLISRRGRTRRPASYPIPPSTRSEDASAPRPITAVRILLQATAQ